MRAVPRFYECNPGIFLTTEEKARKTPPVRLVEECDTVLVVRLQRIKGSHYQITRLCLINDRILYVFRSVFPSVLCQSVVIY